MPDTQAQSGWNILPPVTIPAADRLDHVRNCSDFAAGLLDRFPEWGENLDQPQACDPARLAASISDCGLESGLRRFRNRTMLRIVWRDLAGLATLAETFAGLTDLAETCLQAAIAEQQARLAEKHGIPRAGDGSAQSLCVIGLGKFGGGELNLSSDIDVIFCFPQPGNTDGRRSLSNDQFFTRLARAVIASLADITEDGFCFRVDTRLRPFGGSGPITPSLAAMEQYYQREGRDWERYAMIKARPVAGDRAAAADLLERLKPFVYRRYIDYGSVEALQEMHANVLEDARRKDRLDDIKRGPGGIREIEFLAQCFQLLRGGRDTGLQSPSLDRALGEIERLELLDHEAVSGLRNDYMFLRFLENRIQALRDQQTHRLPEGEDRARIACAMYEDNVAALDQRLERTRRRVSERFQGIFPSRSAPAADGRWAEQWRSLRSGRRDRDEQATASGSGPLPVFVRQLRRLALSRRAHQRLDRFMPELLERLDRGALNDHTLNRVFDLVFAICRRSAYLVLLVQQPRALDRMLELFERSEWIADKVIRFPALLDELIDPALGRYVPAPQDLARGVARILETAPGTETVLANLNYLKLANELRIAVGQLQGSLDGDQARGALSELAGALLGGVLDIAGREIAERHGGFPPPPEDHRPAPGDHQGLAIIGYGSLGACELGYGSDLDLVFLFESGAEASDGARPLPPERYYARLAQRVLSFLTVMTPSGRLYEVDTRLRPNGRAGSLVSSIGAFREYQFKEAWTWELQALTRARHVAGSRRIAARFNRVRQEALCRPRDERALARELVEMRHRVMREHGGDDAPGQAPKHQSGGLVDIEFVAQFGVLTNAQVYPRVIQATGTLPQLRELESIGWLSAREQAALSETMRRLRSNRMLSVLLPGADEQPVDTEAAATIFRDRLGVNDPPEPD